MEVNKKHACGVLRFFKRDGSEGSILPLEANQEHTIGYDNQATIRLKTSKSTLKPIQCVIKVDANGFAKLINKDIAHAVKLNNKPLYSSKYLLPNDVFFVLDKKIRYENQDINKNNLMKLSSKNKMSTPLKSSLSTKGRKSYTVTVRKRSPNVHDDDKKESVIAFKSLKGSKTPHVKKPMRSFSTLSEKKQDLSLPPLHPQAFDLKTPLPEIKIPEAQSPRSIRSKRTPSSRRRSTNKNLFTFCTTSSSGSEETHTGFQVSPFATKLDDLNTPPNNKSIIEINLTPIPSVKKRKSQKFAVTDDLELEDSKTPKTTSHFRNSLHLFSGRKSRKSSLSNTLKSISETAEKFGQSLNTSPNNELSESPATKRVSSPLHSVITPRNATPKLNETYSEEDCSERMKEQETAIKLNETYSEEDLPSGDDQEASVRKSTTRVKLNETYSEDFLLSEKQQAQTSSARNSLTENDELPLVSKQRQTPNARKSVAELNETFTDEKVQVQRPVARKSVRKLNKTFSEADFSSVREQQQMYSPALVKRRFSNFVETTLASGQNSTTPILSRSLQPSSTSTIKRPLKHSSVIENLNSPFFKVLSRSPISNITFRRPLRNVTSTYRLSQENIMLIDSDLERSQNSPKGSVNVMSQENSFSEKAGPVKCSDSISKGIQSPLENSFTKVFHSSPMIKTRRTYSKSMGKFSVSPQLQQSSNQLSPGDDFEQLDVEKNHSFKNNNCTSTAEKKIYSFNEDESSEESSLVKQLTLMLSDEDLAETKVEDEHDFKVNVESYSKSKKSSLLSLKSSANSSLESNNRESSSLLETTTSSSFYYERPSLFAQENNMFVDLPNISSKSKMSTPEDKTKIEQNSAVKRSSKTPKSSFSDSRATAKDQVIVLTDVKRAKTLMGTPVVNRSPKNELTGVKRLLKTPRERKEVKNDLSDVRGVRNLMATPRIERSPLNDVTQVKGLKKLMRTPKPNKSPKNDLSNVAGIRRLMEGPREQKEPENDLSDVRGVRRLVSTPKVQRSPLNDITDVKGVKRLMRTPRAIKSPKNDLSNVAGVRRLMEGPREQKELENDLSDVRGVRRLVSTPKVQRSPLNDITDVKGVKRLMSTPRAIKSPKNDLSNVAGVRRLMEGPREQKEPENDLSDVRGVRRLMNTSKVHQSPLNDLTDLTGIKSLLRTPKLPKSPVNDLSDVYGVRDLIRSPKNRKSTDLNGIKDLMMTPVFNTTASSPNDEASTAEMGDFDALLNKKPVRTYRGKSRSPFTSPKTSDNNVYVQPNVAKWLEEQDNYLQSHSKETEKTGAIKTEDSTPNKEEINLKSRTKTVRQQDLDKMKSEIEFADQSPQFRTTRRRQKGINIEENDVPEIKTTRSKNQQQITEDTEADVIEQSVQDNKITKGRNRNKRKAVKDDDDLEELSQEIKTTRNKRMPRNKQTKLEVPKDIEVEQAAKEIKSPRNRRLPKSKQEVEEKSVESVQEITPVKTGRSLRAKPQIKENDAVQETRATRSRRVPKNKQQIEEDDAQQVMPARTRRLPANKTQTEEKSTNNDEFNQVVENTKNARSKRLPKNKQQIDEDDSKDNDDAEIKITKNDNEDIQVDLPEVEDKLPNNKGQGARANTRSRRHIKDEDAEPKKEVKATRSRRQPKTEEISAVTEKEAEVNEEKVNETQANKSRKYFKKEEIPEPVGVGGVTKNEKNNKQTETKTTRSKKQQKKNKEMPLLKDEEDQENEAQEEKRPSPKLLRTLKRKADASEVPAEQALMKKTKKLVSFDIDSPRRSSRTPRKLRRITDEEFEFDVDKISVGHSKKATKKHTEKTVEENLANPQEPRRSRRTRK